MSDRTRSPKTEEQKAKALASERIIQLVIPIEREGVKVSEIKVRRLKAKEQIEISDMDNLTDSQKMRAMVGRATGMSPDDIGELDGADYIAIQECIDDFLSARRSN